MPRKKSDETLEEGLSRSARKKGLRGKEERRYVGGAIRNMEKKGEFTIRRKPAAPKAARPSTRAQHAAPARRAAAHAAPPAAPARAKKAYERPTMTKRERVELVVKKKGDHYAIYNSKSGAAWNESKFRKLAAAKAEAKIEQDAHNEGYKRGRL